MRQLMALVVALAGVGCGGGVNGSDGGLSGCGGGTGGGTGSCGTRPFGVYTLQTTMPSCPSGWTPWAGTYKLNFTDPQADGGTGITLDDYYACAAAWQDCKVVVSCGSSGMKQYTFELTYSAGPPETFTGMGYDACGCETSGGGNPADCSTTGQKP